MPITDAQARIHSCIHLLTTTTLTEHNYYALYVDNAKVGYICAIWNRLIFFLFGRFDWCLGSATDTNHQILMQHEIIVIDQYNKAKNELLEISTSGAISYERACKTYKRALDLRLGQMTSRFGFSQEAMQLNLKIEEKEILQAAKCDLTEALKAQGSAGYTARFLAKIFEEDEIELPPQTGLTDQKVATQPKPPATTNSSSIDDDDEDYLQLSTPQPSVSTKWDIGKLLYQEDPDTAQEKFLEAETALLNAFKENASKIQTLEDVTVTKVIPEETIDYYARALVKCHISSVATIEEAFKQLSVTYAQTRIAPKCYMILMTVIIKKLSSFAITLDSDALFIPMIQQRFDSFVKVFTPEASVKQKFCYANNALKSMYTLIKTLYKHIHPNESEQTCNQITQNQLETLLKHLYTDKFTLFETHFTPEKLKPQTSEEEFLLGLYKAMHHFKPDATEAQKADLSYFLTKLQAK